MNPLIKLLFSIFFLFSFSLVLGQQPVPQVESVPSSYPNQFDFNLNNLEVLSTSAYPHTPPPDVPLHKDYIEQPRYGIFWIFGDGSFYHQEDDLYLGVTSPCIGPVDPSIDCRKSFPVPYSYRHPDEYEVTAYLTEKYTNDLPPEKTVAKTESFSQTFGPFTPFVSIIPSGAYIEMLTNHIPRRKYETVHTVSFTPDPPINPDQGNNSPRAGAVYFFYGSVNEGTNKNPDADGFAYMRAHLANYYGDSETIDRLNSRITLKSASQFDSESMAGNTFDIDYDSVAILKFDASVANTAVGEGNPEMRSFFITRASKDASIVDKDFNFLAVVAYTDSIDNSSSPNDIDGFKSTYLGGNFVLEQAAGVKYYLGDFTEKNFKVVDSHDPNKLCLYEIVKCEDDYLYKFQLTICNDGRGIANDIFLNFENLYGFNCVDFSEEGERLGGGHTYVWGDLALTTPKDFTGFASDIEVPTNLPGVTDILNAPCLTIYFTAKSDNFDIERLCKEEFLNGSVIFDGNPPERIIGETCFNDSCLNYSPIIIEPGSPEEEECDCLTWWEWFILKCKIVIIIVPIVLVIIVVFARFYFIRRGRIRRNAN